LFIEKNSLMENAKFFQPLGVFPEVRPLRPIKILFLTSLRNAVYGEFNGQVVQVLNRQYYMQGVIERTIEETKHFGLLHGLIEVTGVVFDDTEDDLVKASAQVGPALQPIGGMEIFSASQERLAAYNRAAKIEAPSVCPKNLLHPEQIFSIPSTFRKLRIDDIPGREKAKFSFEETVLKKAQVLGAQIIISDGYMARIDYLHAEMGMHGKTLNIHPAPSIVGMPYCFRGKDEVMDAIRYAQANGGFAKTGATLHFVNGEIDDGNAVAYVCETPVFSHDTEIELMVRNYKQAKLPLFIAGLRHYILNIYPYL